MLAPAAASRWLQRFDSYATICRVPVQSWWRLRSSRADAASAHRMPWRRMVISYGWSITARELEESPHWSAETKARAGVIAGIVMSVPVTLEIGLPYIYWLLTGRGPWHRYGLSSSVVVNPFSRRRPPPEIREALATLADGPAGASCSPRTQPRHG
jgi:hypothetical protein